MNEHSSFTPSEGLIAKLRTYIAVEGQAGISIRDAQRREAADALEEAMNIITEGIRQGIIQTEAVLSEKTPNNGASESQTRFVSGVASASPGPTPSSATGASEFSDKLMTALAAKFGVAWPTMVRWLSGEVVPEPAFQEFVLKAIYK